MKTSAPFRTWKSFGSAQGPQSSSRSGLPTSYAAFEKYHPVWLNTHFNTSIEITKEAKEACEKLVNAGVPVGNQAVIWQALMTAFPL
ncbi:hypothetical protein PO124_03855 [Bacillus licheniformis]|nr:hypothetical protein [Bacillus licheniformis]